MADNDDFVDEPVEEVRDLLESPDPDLGGRVRRSINRNVLVGDSLELVFSGLVRTAWSYIELALNYFDVLKNRGETPGGADPSPEPPKDEEPES